MEHWRQHPNYVLYEVSNLGNIRRSAVNVTVNGVSWSLPSKQLKYNSRRGDRGYYSISINTNHLSFSGMSDRKANRKTVSLHRLVAECFVPKREGCNIVNHKDGNTRNNCQWNLEWVTQRENVYHGAIGRGSKQPGVCKVTRYYESKKGKGVSEYVHWVANISIDSKSYTIGTYKTEAEAIKAFKKESKKLKQTTKYLNG